MTVPHVLIVDDDTALLQALPEALKLRLREIEVDTCETALGALDRIANVDYDAIVSDIKMPGMDGLALLERIHVIRPQTPTLLITGHGEHDLAIQALRGGAYDFIQKPIDRDYFIASLSRAIQMRQLSRQVDEHRATLERHASALEHAVLERTRELQEANQVKDELLITRDRALAETTIAKHRMTFLAEASSLFASSLDTESILSIVVRLAVPRLADWCFVHTVADDDALHLRALAHVNPAEEPTLRELVGRLTLDADRAIAQAVRTGRAVLHSTSGDATADTETGSARGRPRSRPRLLPDLEVTSYMSVPMIARGRTMGTITFVAAESGRHFGGDDLSLAEDLARRTAMSADNARLYQQAQDAVAQQTEALQRVEGLANLLGQHAQELTTIIESMPNAVYVCDADGQITRINASAAQLAGRSVSDVQTHMPHHALMSLCDLTGVTVPIEDYPLTQALRGIRRDDLRFVIPSDDNGEEIHVRMSCAPIRDSEGQITGGVAVATDISALYRLERQKDEFLSVASHELKTPLTSLKTLAQLTHRKLERDGVALPDHLLGMERAIGRMQTLVDDILDISRIESGKLALRPERCDLITLCKQAVDEQSAATGRTITLVSPDASEPTLDVVADVDRIGQVLTNLLSNALKYSPADTPVSLAVTREGNDFLLAVRDQGPGIPPHELAHIFDRFYRVPGIEVRTGSGVGLGLGLHICREIMERHGGRVWADSVPGHGSTFWVSLPAAVTTRPMGRRPTRIPVDRHASSN